jgi:two-component system, cell cycle sensor histidine kinase and response regulator CckA
MSAFARETERFATPELSFRRLIEGIPAMTYVEALVESNERDGNPALWVSPQLAEFFGVPAEEMLGSPWWWNDRIHPDDLGRVVAEDERTTKTGEPFSVDYRVIRGDGLDMWVHDEALLLRDEGGQPLFWLGVIRDITDRKLAEEELRISGEHYRLLFESARASSERLRGLIDASPLAIMTWDRDGRILSWNPAAERIFGWTEEQAIGRFLPQVQDDARDEMMTYIERGFRGETWSGIELPRRRKDGVLIECSISSAAIRDADGQVVAVMSILEDVSDRRRLERELAQAQKMEAMGRLAGGVAHDFNNMLTAIEGYASLGLMTPDLDPDIRRSFVEILRAARSSADLTRQLLTFTRQQVFQPVVLDLNDVVRGADSMLARLLGDDVAMRLVLAAEAAHIRADPSQVDQLLVNLAVNARAAMPVGGVLTVETSTGDFETVLRIADTGIGMDEETLSRAFEPFFTTRATSTGLGLSTVYAIVEQSGGRIAIDSEEGRGTTVTIAWPAVDDRSTLAARAAGPKASLEGDETILLVEDQQAVRNVARIALQRRGYHVIEAGSPSIALQLIDEEAADFDLVVTDVVLPGMNGRELVEAIRARLPGIPALYMSGYAEDAIAHDGVLEPDVPFLVKPFTPDELVGKVRDLLD